MRLCHISFKRVFAWPCCKCPWWFGGCFSAFLLAHSRWLSCSMSNGITFSVLWKEEIILKSHVTKPNVSDKNHLCNKSTYWEWRECQDLGFRDPRWGKCQCISQRVGGTEREKISTVLEKKVWNGKRTLCKCHLHVRKSSTLILTL